MTVYRAGTIVARNYLAQARVLARSFSFYNPQIAFSTLIVDGVEADRETDGVGMVILPSDLSIEPEILHSMMIIYDVTEFSTALKPSLLSLLLPGADAVAYFDPDIRVYDALTDVFEQARDHGIVLTPHTLSAVPRDDRALSERSIMQAGIYNLGFISVGQLAVPFLLWWHERLTIDAISDVENGLFTDQRWIDWVPALFPHMISRDRGLNAAYWNLHERPISRRSTGFHAGEHPLRFFHFSGFDPQRPWILSKHTGDRPRTLISGSEELRELVWHYKSELDEFEHSERRRAAYGLATLGTGLPLPLPVRRLVRLCSLGQLPFPAPPDAIEDPVAFAEWLDDRAATAISPVQWAFWNARADLRAAFPDPFGVDSESFRVWFASDSGGRAWMDQFRAFLPSQSVHLRVVSAPVAPKAFGWSIVAYAKAELGVGEAGRRTADAVAATGIPMELVSTAVACGSRQQHASHRRVEGSIGFHNVVTCVNADMLPLVSANLGLQKLRGYHAGLWFWELEEFPEHYGKSLELVDEVWTASEFTRQAIQAVTDKPVRLIRMPIYVPFRPTAYTRASLGMPESKFIFLTNFDYLSTAERKNPVGVIRAYLDAFGPDDGAVLMVKSINSSQRILESERVRSFAYGRPDVMFLDEYVSTTEMKAMIELADCFVSLHRAEGYGLNLADAMAHSTPTIATGYSGNLEFMTETTSILIPHKIVEVGPDAAPYNPSAVWAEPDLYASSTAMRRLFDDPESGSAMAQRALTQISRSHSLQAAAASVRGLLLGTRSVA
jgi:glycosyltransferase involved in cell wall biosynthesis